MASHSLHNACVRCLGLRYIWGFGAAGTDALNDRIRRLRSDGSVVTLVGSDYSFADGKTKDARFNSPVGVALLGDEIIVADCGNNCTDSSSAPRDCPPRASSALACCVLAFCACFVTSPRCMAIFAPRALGRGHARPRGVSGIKEINQ